MIRHQLPIGTHGLLEIKDYSDRSTSKYVELWLQTSIILEDRPVVPWWSVVDDVQSPMSSYTVPRTLSNTRVSRIYVDSTAASFTWHIEDTETEDLGGPYDFAVTLASGLAQAKAYVKVGTDWKRAIPWVRVAGVWQVAVPQVMVNSEWKPAN